MGLSVLLTTTMPNLRSIIEALELSGLRDQVIVMVGGAPVTQEYVNEITADIYAADAASAARKAKERFKGGRVDESKRKSRAGSES